MPADLTGRNVRFRNAGVLLGARDHALGWENINVMAATSQDGRRVFLINVSTKQQVAVTDDLGEPLGAALFFQGHLWVMGCGGTLFKVDDETGELLDSFTIDSESNANWIERGQNADLFLPGKDNRIVRFRVPEGEVESETFVNLSRVQMGTGVFIPPFDTVYLVCLDGLGHAESIQWTPAFGFQSILDKKVPGLVDIRYGRKYQSTIIYVVGGRLGLGLLVPVDVTDPLDPVPGEPDDSLSEFFITSLSGASPSGRVGTIDDAGEFPDLPWWYGITECFPTNTGPAAGKWLLCHGRVGDLMVYDENAIP